MKKTRWICFLAVLALTVSVCASALALSPDTMTLGRADSFTQRAITAWMTPGLSGRTAMVIT